MLKTPAAENLFLFIDSKPLTVEEKDPWKSWIFDLYGSAMFSSHKTYQDFSFSGGLYCSKVTPEIKFESMNNFFLNESRIKIFDDNDSVVYSFFWSQKDYSSDNLLVKSLGNHCGIGGIASFNKSEYNNLDFQILAGPAIEFNLFSYEDVATREFKFLYTILYEYSDYKKVTVFNRMSDQLFRQDLRINFSYYLSQRGTISANVYGSTYLDDLSQFSLGATAMISVNLFKGLSVRFSGGMSYYENQRTLRKEPYSEVNYIPGQWELEKQFGYSFGIGLSFRFGSKNNNTVNARFN
jgi:hypothetical protein